MWSLLKIKFISLNILPPGKVFLISIKLDTQVQSKRIENLFPNDLLDGHIKGRKTLLLPPKKLTSKSQNCIFDLNC